MKKCLFCKAEVSKNEKICPNCGKRCFSRKWLIAILIIAIFLVGGIFGGSEEENSYVNNSTNSSSTENQVEENSSANSSSTENQGGEKKQKKYGLNEPVVVVTSEGSYRLTLTGVTETTERNQFSDKQANRVIIISYEYENINSEENVYIFDSHFKIYDKDNNSLETYPVTTKGGESVSIGRKTTATMAYALNNDQNYIEIEHYSNMFNSKYDYLFNIEW